MFYSTGSSYYLSCIWTVPDNCIRYVVLTFSNLLCILPCFLVVLTTLYSSCRLTTSCCTFLKCSSSSNNQSFRMVHVCFRCFMVKRVFFSLSTVTCSLACGQDGVFQQTEALIHSLDRLLFIKIHAYNCKELAWFGSTASYELTLHEYSYNELNWNALDYKLNLKGLLFDCNWN